MLLQISGRFGECQFEPHLGPQLFHVGYALVRDYADFARSDPRERHSRVERKADLGEARQVGRYKNGRSFNDQTFREIGMPQPIPVGITRP